MKKLWPVAICICLGACSQTVPVNGKVEKTNERFVGTATSDISGQGNLFITTDAGVTCQSKFDVSVVSSYTEGVSSHGIVSCSDGRTGNFAYSGTALQGNGFGTFSDGRKFIFTYGAASNVKIQEF